MGPRKVGSLGTLSNFSFPRHKRETSIYLSIYLSIHSSISIYLCLLCAEPGKGSMMTSNPNLDSVLTSPQADRLCQVTLALQDRQVRTSPLGNSQKSDVGSLDQFFTSPGRSRQLCFCLLALCCAKGRRHGVQVTVSVLPWVARLCWTHKSAKLGKTEASSWGAFLEKGGH